MENEAGPHLADPSLHEASGLAVSRRDSDFLWLLNDSGSPPRLHLANRDGRARGFVLVTGVKNQDWEDLAAFKLDGIPYLLIADTGDNESKRPTVSLHLLEEPALPSDGASINMSLAPKWTIRFRYQDGPRDCECVAVDPVAKTILLLSKRTKLPQLYELPLRQAAAGEILVAKHLGPIVPPKVPKNSLPHPYGPQPTGFDISSNARLAAVVTYRGSFLYPRADDESWTQAFAKKPHSLGAHSLAQAESIAFTPDGRSVILVSEGRRSPIIRLSVP